MRFGDLFVLNPLGRELKLQGTSSLEERDYLLDDYQPMGRERLMGVIKEELAK